MQSRFNSVSSVNPSKDGQKNSRLPKASKDDSHQIRQQMLEAERSDLAGITKQYLDLSTVHGLRYDVIECIYNTNGG